jgi:hypothetical protein
LGYERSGRDDYFDGETGLSYSVSQLLDSVVKPEERKKEGREEGSRIYFIRESKEKEPPASDRKLTDIQQLTKKIEQLKMDLLKEEKLKELCDGEAEKKARRLEKDKKKQYTVHRFSMDEYERLNRELENAQSLHQQLLE